MDLLYKCNFLRNLKSIDLSINDIGEKGMSFISNCAFLRNLTSINLSHNSIGDKGMSYLKDCKFLKNLTDINMSNNKISLRERENNRTKTALFKSIDVLLDSRDRNGGKGIHQITTISYFYFILPYFNRILCCFNRI